MTSSSSLYHHIHLPAFHHHALSLLFFACCLFYLHYSQFSWRCVRVWIFCPYLVQQSFRRREILRRPHQQLNVWFISKATFWSTSITPFCQGFCQETWVYAPWLCVFVFVAHAIINHMTAGYTLCDIPPVLAVAILSTEERVLLYARGYETGEADALRW